MELAFNRAAPYHQAAFCNLIVTEIATEQPRMHRYLYAQTGLR